MQHKDMTCFITCIQDYRHTQAAQRQDCNESHSARVQLHMDYNNRVCYFHIYNMLYHSKLFGNSIGKPVTEMKQLNVRGFG